MIDLRDADPITRDVLVLLHQYEATTEYKREALVSAIDALDAMTELEIVLCSRGQWQATDNGLIQVY
jgi:hypothetical protein